ncbi:MAG: hypothetical protein LBQ89_01725 [Treponema sp.]|nr:hypothetical protein [Treponema sp.]
MKKVIKVLAITAAVLTMFAETAWAEENAASGGALKITGVQARDGQFTEGNYVIGLVTSENDDFLLYFGAGEPVLEDYLPAARIKDGTVTLKAFVSTDGGTTWSVYTGNDSVDMFKLFIIESDTDAIADPANDSYNMYINTVPVKFSNGSASINFADMLFL